MRKRNIDEPINKLYKWLCMLYWQLDVVELNLMVLPEISSFVRYSKNFSQSWAACSLNLFKASASWDKWTNTASLTAVGLGMEMCRLHDTVWPLLEFV